MEYAFLKKVSILHAFFIVVKQQKGKCEQLVILYEYAYTMINQ